MNALLVICGPTATGKTKLAFRLAKEFDGELVSADSRQIYRGMDIVTGKDLPETYDVQMRRYEFRKTTYRIPGYVINGVPLWMYDVVDPDSEFSVSHYRFLAKRVLSDIRKRKKLPIVVGGTGFYINSLIQPLSFIDIPKDVSFREKIETASVSQLQAMLQEENSEFWKTMNESDRRNPRRLIRKIEIARYKKTHLAGRALRKERQNVFMIGLKEKPDVLKKRIEERVEKRMQQGARKEVESLHRKGYRWSLSSMSGLGYRQWRDWEKWKEKGGLSEQSIIAQWKKDEWKYAKRQMIWFKKQKTIAWLEGGNVYENAVQLVKEWYNKKRE